VIATDCSTQMLPRLNFVFLMLLGLSLALGAALSHYQASFGWIVLLAMLIAAGMVWVVSREDPVFIAKRVPRELHRSALAGTLLVVFQFFGMFFGAGAATYFITRWFGW
jgi:uncharacterized membrane protein